MMLSADIGADGVPNPRERSLALNIRSGAGIGSHYIEGDA